MGHRAWLASRRLTQRVQCQHGVSRAVVSAYSAGCSAVALGVASLGRWGTPENVIQLGGKWGGGREGDRGLTGTEAGEGSVRRAAGGWSLQAAVVP